MSIYHFSNTPHGTMKSGEKINTLTHYNYICRQGRYKHMRDHREDLAYVASGNIPDGDTKKFWSTAETFRRKNGRAYREIRLGLQEELSLEDNIDLIEKFLERSGIKEKHAYSYAIHDKIATFDAGHRNIHVHIMFNEREQEKDRPLSLTDYFKRYSVNKENQPTGGYKMSEYFRSKQSTIDMRKQWEEIVNEKFNERNLPQRVSSTTLKKQRDQLLKEGRTEEAELINRKPGPHLGATYRTKRMLDYIWKRIEAIERQQSDPNYIEPEHLPEHMSTQEQIIDIFAYDRYLRNTARSIQKERLAMNQVIARNIADENQQISEPFLITAGDMKQYLEIQKANTTDQKELKILLDIEETLAMHRDTDILFTHQIPKEITREDKLYGTKPIASLPMFSKGNKIYARIGHGQAIRIGETITNGMATVYDCSKNIPVPTSDTVPLYKQGDGNMIEENIKDINAKLKKEMENERERTRTMELKPNL